MLFFPSSPINRIQKWSPAHLLPPWPPEQLINPSAILNFAVAAVESWDRSSSNTRNCYGSLSSSFFRVSPLFRCFFLCGISDQSSFELFCTHRGSILRLEVRARRPKEQHPSPMISTLSSWSRYVSLSHSFSFCMPFYFLFQLTSVLHFCDDDDKCDPSSFWDLRHLKGLGIELSTFVWASQTSFTFFFLMFFIYWGWNYFKSNLTPVWFNIFFVWIVGETAILSFVVCIAFVIFMYFNYVRLTPKFTLTLCWVRQ